MQRGPDPSVFLLLLLFPNSVSLGRLLISLLNHDFIFKWKSKHSLCSSSGTRVTYPVAQLLSRVQLFPTPWTAARQASLSITNSQSLLKAMSIESVMPSNHLILCRPLLLLPSIFPYIRVFSSESVLCIRWPKYWSFSFSISPSSDFSGLIYFRMDWSLLQHHNQKA